MPGTDVGCPRKKVVSDAEDGYVGRLRVDDHAGTRSFLSVQRDAMR